MNAVQAENDGRFHVGRASLSFGIVHLYDVTTPRGHIPEITIETPARFESFQQKKPIWEWKETSKNGSSSTAHSGMLPLWIWYGAVKSSFDLPKGDKLLQRLFRINRGYFNTEIHVEHDALSVVHGNQWSKTHTLYSRCCGIAMPKSWVPAPTGKTVVSEGINFFLEEFDPLVAALFFDQPATVKEVFTRFGGEECYAYWRHPALGNHKCFQVSVEGMKKHRPRIAFLNEPVEKRAAYLSHFELVSQA